MKRNSFLTRAYMLTVCVCLILLSCEDKPEMSLSLHEVEIDSFSTDTVHIDVYSNVKWVVSINNPTDTSWLMVTPKEGRGNGTLNILVSENSEFTERTATIVISGNNGISATIKVLQAQDYDILPLINDIDPIFKQYCLDSIDFNKDGSISTKEARMTDTIIVSELQIRKLEGIEHFTQLTYLDCSSNLIESLDLSKNTKLNILNCRDNYIVELDMTKNAALTKLYCSYNPISHLDVSGLKELTEVEIFFAKLENINVSTNTNLLYLSIPGNSVSSLDISNNVKLRFLDCSRNIISSLDVNNNTELVSLYCNINRLSTLNISSNTKLQHLRCDENRFTGGTLNLNNNIELLQFGCEGNRFTSLNMSNNLKLERLWCKDNQLTTLDLTNNTRLSVLICSNNNLTGTLNISNIESLRNLEIDLRNNKLTIIEVPPGFILFAEHNEKISKDSEAEWVEKP